MTPPTTPDHLTLVRPWGLGRLAPYPMTTKVPYRTVTIDPVPQTGVFLDHLSQVVELGKPGQPAGLMAATDERAVLVATEVNDITADTR